MKYTYVKVGQCTRTRITTQGYLTEQFLFIYIYIYLYMCNSLDCMGVNGEALQLHAVYFKKKHFLLQVTREFVSYYKSHKIPVQLCIIVILV